jgi:DNA-binding transcriptional ArsR family regulator
MATEQDDLSRDLIFDTLSSARRRFILYYLQEHEGPIELGELSEAVAAWENDVEVEDLTSQQRKRVYVSLYQTHIPKMADAEILEYDEEAGTVSLGERGPVLRRYLEDTDVDERNWQLYYLGFSIVASVVFIGTVYDVGAFAAVSEVVVGILVTLAFGALALLHLGYVWYHRSEHSFSQFENR